MSGTVAMHENPSLHADRSPSVADVLHLISNTRPQQHADFEQLSQNIAEAVGPEAVVGRFGDQDQAQKVHHAVADQPTG